MKTSSTKYTAFAPIQLADRQWPNRVIDKAPIWMSTDLRDGNQALFEPMNAEKKMRMFKTLCTIGFKEIEIAFPSASETEFGFVRGLIEGGHIPDDVTIEVLTQAREHLIRRTLESVKGSKQAIVHVYNATCKTFRDNVFGMSKAEVVAMAVDAVKLIRQLADEMPETKITLEYSPELFTATELDFALEVCDAVTAAWGATPERKVILGYQRRRPHLRTLHPAPDPPAPPVCGGSRFHGFLRLPSGRHQERVFCSKGRYSMGCALSSN
jgi:2-isopropylmalate synthase